MFFSESQAILARIHGHLAAWRADGPDAELLAAMRGEFAALQQGAEAAGFDDVAALGQSVENLLAQGDVTDPDDSGMLNLLEEVHDGLAADLGFVPAAARDHVKSLKSLVALLLRDVRPTASDASPDAPAGTFNEFLPRLREVAGQTAEEWGRQVELSFTGGEVEADRRVLESMAAPLEHLIRHFVEHSLEPADQRAASGKPAAGRIGIAVMCRGAELCIEYSDDGAGVARQKLAAEAVRMGMTAAADEVGEAHFLQILIHAGGGMERVCRAVRDLGGLMAVKSGPGGGVRFQFLLPATLDASRVLLITVGEYRFAIPAHLVERVLRVSDKDVTTHDRGKTITLDERQIAVVDLAAEISPPGTDDVRWSRPVAQLVLVRLADRVVALEVDAVLDVAPVVIHPPGAQLASIRGVTGVAVAEDSSTTLALDPDAFIRRELLQHHGLTRFPLMQPQPEEKLRPKQPPLAGKIMRVLVLETGPAPVLIPAAMVAAVVIAAARRSPELELEPAPVPESEPALESKPDPEPRLDLKLESEPESGRAPESESRPAPRPSHAPEWMYGQHSWRGFKVPVINSAAAFGAGGEPARPWAHAVILWPLKGGRPDEFFALTADGPPRMMEVEDRPAPAPRNIAVQPNHLLGYVRMDRRVALVPDLNALARGIFRER